MSLKGAKSPTRGRKLRSTGTKARPRVDRMRKPRADLEQQLEKYRHELVEAREHLAEALEQQTATSEVLRVIAGTPEDSRRALNTIAETAARMFDAAGVNFRRIEGDVLRVVGAAGPTMARVWEALPDLPLEPTDLAVRSVLDNRQMSIEDRRVALANERGEVARVLRDLPVRSQAFTPLSRQGKAIGVMIVARSEVRPFQPGELDLMRGFADQAVIAIENARLLKELRQRTADLGESLQQQTATADVLKVISRSTFDVQAVFNTLVESAARLCDAKQAMIWRQKTSPPRPSSPSRTRACSTSCASGPTISVRRWSNRQRLPRCSRSSPGRLANWSRYSMPCWRMRRGSARPNSEHCC